MAVCAGEVISGIAQARIDGASADVGRRVGNELPSVADEVVFRLGRQP
jgi:hypothetical protein